MTQPEQIVELLTSTGQASPADIIGCTEEQIAELESWSSVHLPQTYKHFLRVMGCKAGSFLADCSWAVHDLPHARQVLDEKIQATENSIQLSKTAFIFLECSAAEILFFDAADGDDPPVYLIESLSEQPYVWSKSLSEWLDRAATEVRKMASTAS